MIHPLEQHDELYRKAFEKYRQRDLEQARMLAQAAAEIAYDYLLTEGLAVPVDNYTCRAKALLRLIDETADEKLENKDSFHNSP